MILIPKLRLMRTFFHRPGLASHGPGRTVSHTLQLDQILDSSAFRMPGEARTFEDVWLQWL